jgi:hypothetical protein
MRAEVDKTNLEGMASVLWVIDFSFKRAPSTFTLWVQLTLCFNLIGETEPRHLEGIIRVPAARADIDLYAPEYSTVGNAMPPNAIQATTRQFRSKRLNQTRLPLPIN